MSKLFYEILDGFEEFALITHNEEMLNRINMSRNLANQGALGEDTVKTSDGKWTNKGKDGTHGKFRTKKEADAQRKAMFANGYSESLTEDADTDGFECVGTERSGGKNYGIFRKVVRDENGNVIKGVWKACPTNSDIHSKHFGDLELDNMFDITYDQALGRKPISDDSSIEKLSKTLGRVLLPKRESVNRRLYFGKALNEKVSPDGYAPEKTGKAYKVFRVKNGKLYPPMVANAGGQDTPVGVWLDAEEGEFAGLSKTGRQQVKSIGSGTLAYRPGWHLGDVPRAPQFDRLNKETGEMEFPKDFVWAECDYAMDVDYQPEADEMGYMRTKVDDEGNVTTYKSDKYQHSLAGLKKLPSNGYYKYRTNPRPDTVPWVITGQMKVNRLLSDDEVNEILQSKGIAPIHRQGGDKTLAELGLGGISEAVEKDAEKSNVCPNCGTIMVKDATGMHCPKCDKQPKNDDVAEDFKDPDKMSKKDKKAYYSKQRNMWERNPMTKVKPSGKIYKRDKKVEIEESLLQDIHNDSVSIAKDLGMTSDEMWAKIHEWEKENPHPEFSGAIFYSRPLWNKFMKWLRKDVDNFDRDDFEPSMPNDGFEYDDSDVDSLGKLPF